MGSSASKHLAPLREYPRRRHGDKDRSLLSSDSTEACTSPGGRINKEVKSGCGRVERVKDAFVACSRVLKAASSFYPEQCCNRQRSLLATNALEGHTPNLTLETWLSRHMESDPTETSGALEADQSWASEHLSFDTTLRRLLVQQPWLQESAPVQDLITSNCKLGECHLLRLPNELLLEIIKFAKEPMWGWDADRQTPLIALWQTCRRFRAIIEPVVPTDLEKETLRLLILHDRFDRFAALCKIEELVSDSHLALCRPCLNWHSKVDFSYNELHTPGAERACRYAAVGGRLRLCEHSSMTRYELQRAHRSRLGDLVFVLNTTYMKGLPVYKYKPIKPRPLFGSCDGEDWALSHRHATYINHKREMIDEKEAILVATLSGAWSPAILEPVRLPQVVLRGKIALLLQKYHKSFCPHLQRKAELFGLDIILLTFSAHGIAVIKCDFPNCETLVEVDENSVVRVQRNLGSLEDPADPKWLAQSIPGSNPLDLDSSPKETLQGKY